MFSRSPAYYWWITSDICFRISTLDSGQYKLWFTVFEICFSMFLSCDSINKKEYLIVHHLMNVPISSNKEHMNLFQLCSGKQDQCCVSIHILCNYTCYFEWLHVVDDISPTQWSPFWLHRRKGEEPSALCKWWQRKLPRWDEVVVMNTAIGANDPPGYSSVKKRKQ